MSAKFPCYTVYMSGLFHVYTWTGRGNQGLLYIRLVLRGSFCTGSLVGIGRGTGFQPLPRPHPHLFFVLAASGNPLQCYGQGFEVRLHSSKPLPAIVIPWRSLSFGTDSQGSGKPCSGSRDILAVVCVLDSLVERIGCVWHLCVMEYPAWLVEFPSE